MSTLKEIPDSFEVVEHHDNLTLHDSERGIIVSVNERNGVQIKPSDEYRFKVTLTANQKTQYQGVFDSQSHAEDKARELANSFTE